MTTKQCSRCKNNLNISDFYQRTGAKSHHSACKVCERVMAKDWYERNKKKAAAKVREWREQNIDVVKKYRADNRQKHYRQEVVRKYGVDVTWFDDQLQLQNNACLCCKILFKWGDKQTTPHVDHCHISQTVRGILCNRCNTVLGLCKDSKELFKNLLGYLECHG